MPILRYFVFVGGALLALLFGVNLVVPKPAGDQPTGLAAATDLPQIRIHSDHKPPERVVIDTRQPTIIPPSAKTVAVAAPQAPVPTTAQKADMPPVLAEMSAKTRVREAFAQFTPSDTNTGKIKKTQPVAQPKRKIAKLRPPPSSRPMMLVAQQPHYGFFNTTW